MEFSSESEYLTAVLLIPIFSAILFLVISFIEILDKHGEFIFINKNHTYTHKDFILPFILALLVGLLFYGFFFHLENFLESLPVPDPIDCGLGSECHNKELKAQQERKDFFKLLTSWINDP